MDPVTIGVAITTVISIVAKVISWVKRYSDINASAIVPLSLESKTNSHAAILPPQTNTNNRKFEYENSKDFSPSYHSHNDNSSSNSNVLFPLMFIFIIILGTMAFIIYRKQNRLKENYSRFEYAEKQIDSPPSPSTEQTDVRLTLI